MKHFGCVVNTNLTPTCIVLVNLFFCLNILHYISGLQYIAGEDSFHLWQGLCLFLTQKWLLWLFPVSASLSVCVMSHTPCSTDSFPSATCGSPTGETTEKTFCLNPRGCSDSLTSDKLLPFAIYGILNSVESPDHILTCARNIFLNVSCFCVEGRK